MKFLSFKKSILLLGCYIFLKVCGAEPVSYLRLSNASGDSYLNKERYSQLILTCGVESISVQFGEFASTPVSDLLGTANKQESCVVTAKQSESNIELAEFTASYDGVTNKLTHSKILYNSKQICKQPFICSNSQPLNDISLQASFNEDEWHGPGCICEIN